jgi:hypothetical protein
MSPTVAELVVGIIAAVLVFLAALRIIPLLVEQLAAYLDRPVDVDSTGDHDQHEN